MRKLKPKDDTVKRHFLRRFQERYGIKIDEDSYVQIIKQIQNKDIQTFVVSQSISRKVHRIKLKGKEYLVVYNPIKKILHTVLPEDATGNEMERFRNDNTVALSGISYSGNMAESDN